MLYPIGIQNFEKLREGGFVYVDKTEHIFRLVSTGAYYFLSRPRRFGKSLLTSTIEAYFQGKRELFSGLAIDRLENEWVEHPIMHIDFSGVAYKSPDVLMKVLDQFIAGWEHMYGVEASSDVPGLRFQKVIDAAAEKTGRKVVVLIDEYDKPIVDNISEPELMETFRAQLQGFYSTLKAKDGQIRFCFLTGVSKIGKMSVFSGLNNLRDISMLPEYNDICGISENELHMYFDGSVDELAQANAMSKDECYAKLRDMYDGYDFCGNSGQGMYNPFSLLNTFAGKHFGSYWFETGTPTLLVDVMKKTTFDVTRIEGQKTSAPVLGGINSIFENPVPLFFQTGYLTIKKYDPSFGLYTLGFPNREVKDGFLNFLADYYVPVRPGEGASLIYDLYGALTEGRPEDFMEILDSLFSNVSYQIQGNAEKDFQYAMYIILELLGLHVEVEHSTSNGRIDMLVSTKDFIYVIEIKVDSSADAALRQIEEKGYARPFTSDPRMLWEIGVNFSTADRRIEGWKVIQVK